MRAAVLAAALFVTQSTGCSATSAVPRRVTGSWGGRGAGFEAPESGDARIELDCAHGSVGIPLAVAADGTFLWNGTYTVERGGPTRKEDAEAPARYRGTLEGETITLTIETDTATVAGPLVLTRNEAPRIRKCR